MHRGSFKKKKMFDHFRPYRSANSCRCFACQTSARRIKISNCYYPILCCSCNGVGKAGENVIDNAFKPGIIGKRLTDEKRVRAIRFSVFFFLLRRVCSV